MALPAEPIIPQPMPERREQARVPPKPKPK